MKKSINRTRGRIYWFLVALMVLLALAGLYKEIASEEARYERYVSQLEYVYTKDVKGGSTPEETLQLFVAALEGGDINDALLYIVPEKREYYRDDLVLGLESGGLQALLDDYRTIDNSLPIDNFGYEFYNTDSETGARITHRLIFNDVAKIWMFESI